MPNHQPITPSLPSLQHHSPPLARPHIRLRNGLCAVTLFRDALKVDVYGSRRNTFQRALLAITKTRAGRFPGYTVLEEIGRGGMGIIYCAREDLSGRIVALKCLSTAGAASDLLVARFRREAQTSAELRHPHIIPIYAVGQTGDGLPFFSMKLASGGSVDRARAEYRDDFRKTVRMMHCVALAIHYAHQRGILHRDLKPSNILLADSGLPMVSDFGLARCIKDATQLTRTFDGCGTPAYMSPEQLAGRPATVATDIYAIGAILFELLTGRKYPPDHALYIEGYGGMIRSNSLWSSICPPIPVQLKAICERCLERVAEDRYLSSKALASDLENWLTGRSVSVRRSTLPLRIGRRLRRDRRVRTGLIVSLVLLALAFSWQIRNWRFENAARKADLLQHSVRVVPFVNLDDLSNNPSWSSSLAVSLESQLQRFGPARVESFVPPSGNRSYADVVRAVKARAVLTGTTRKVGGVTRVVLRLLDCATMKPLFTTVSEQNDANIDHVLTAETIGKIYNILDAPDWTGLIDESGDPAMKKQESREAILAGRELILQHTVNELDRAIVLLTKAVEETPASTLAHAYLSSAASSRTHYVADWTYLKIGLEHAVKAMELSPNSGEAHRALAACYYQQGKFRNALEEGFRTVETAGIDERGTRFLAMTFDMLGSPEQALQWFTLASEITGTRADVGNAIGDCWVTLGDDERAVEIFRRSMELQRDRTVVGVSMCRLRMLQGQFDAARRLCQEILVTRDDFVDGKAIAAQIEFFGRNFAKARDLYEKLSNLDPQDGSGGAFYGAVTYHSALGRAKQVLGDELGAKQLLERCLAYENAAREREPENPEVYYRLAAVESSLLQVDTAIEHLRQAVRLGWDDYRSLALDPRFDCLRADHQFQEIIHRLAARAAAVKSKLNNQSKGATDGIKKLG